MHHQVGDEPILVAGAGLSGLSVVAHIAAARIPVPVTLVDDGSRDLDTMTWSSWSDHPGLLDDAVTRSYDRIAVHVGGRSRVLGLGAYRYRVVRGHDLHAVIRRLVGTTVTFRRGHVEAIHGGNVVVDGEDLPARWVLDSALGHPRHPRADARLAFRGWHVRTEQPVFVPDLPTLFDFRTRQLGGASFMYVLPVDRHHGLVEHTSFVPPDGYADTPRQQEALGEYVREVLDARGFEIESEEAATLPLTAAPAPRRYGNALTIGTQAGMVKASPGYGYERVQADSAAIARSLRRHGHPFDIPTPPPRFRLYDGALLDLVIRDPSTMERAFSVLFRHATAEPALRFLDEGTAVPDEVSLFATMSEAGAFIVALAGR
ncbi:lycopene beta-cyclase [Saccharothrix ecbatanensis]|uniref:Lycopene beta-cyclase n=1 Tax=Saccharothrix ecbatanensis TaxID=1105145 RepID=A0A7W9HFG6_9PSEU|nr:lycopene cyclase family protein [Saccharothrix ecbatanensis]MBB5801210.1 lycopene beta-cyclase [Saccharothrix ecbatanensis]